VAFAGNDLHRWLEDAGFKKIEISVVAREEQPPHFQTILAGAENNRSSRGNEAQTFQFGSQSLLTSAATKSSHNQVHHPLGHDDDFLDALAGDELLYFLGSFRRHFNCRVVCVHSHLDRVP